MRPWGRASTSHSAGPVRELTITQPAGDFSPITGLRLTSGDTAVDVTVPAAGVDGRSTVTLPEPLTGPELAIEITTVEPRTTTDRRYGDPVALPAAISELSAGTRTVLPADLDTGCRDDLLAIDGTPVPVQVVAPVADLLAGSPVEAVLCEPELALDDGPHELETTAGTGLQVDRVVLAGPQADRGARRRSDDRGDVGRPDQPDGDGRRVPRRAVGWCSARDSTTPGGQRSPARTWVRRSSSMAASTGGAFRRPSVRSKSRCTGQPSDHRRSPCCSPG